MTNTVPEVEKEITNREILKSQMRSRRAVRIVRLFCLRCFRPPPCTGCVLISHRLTLSVRIYMVICRQRARLRAYERRRGRPIRISPVDPQSAICLPNRKFPIESAIPHLLIVDEIRDFKRSPLLSLGARSTSADPLQFVTTSVVRHLLKSRPVTPDPDANNE